MNDSQPNPLRVERTFPVPAEKVWRALTINEEMKQWYFQLPEFRAEVGFEFSFEGSSKSGTKYNHHCRIVEVVPNQKIAYSWDYEGYEGSSSVAFELFSEGDGATRVVLTHAGLETFPASNTDFAVGNFEEGWNAILGELLGGYLGK